jgi:hypothetical protein
LRKLIKKLRKLIIGSYCCTRDNIILTKWLLVLKYGTRFLHFILKISSHIHTTSHIKEITRTGNRRLCHLRQCRKADLPTEVGLATYCTKIRPLLEYAVPVWGGLPHYLENDLERIQRRSLRIIGLPVHCKNTMGWFSDGACYTYILS